MRTTVNPDDGEPIFRVLSSAGVERLRVEHRGRVAINNHLFVDGPDADTGGVGNITATGDITAEGDLGVSGNATVDGDLTVTGTITNLDPTVSDEFTVSRDSGDSGSAQERLMRMGNSICFVEDYVASGSPDLVGCGVIEGVGANRGWWMLRATRSGGEFLTCKARCLSW